MEQWSPLCYRKNTLALPMSHRGDFSLLIHEKLHSFLNIFRIYTVKYFFSRLAHPNQTYTFYEYIFLYFHEYSVLPWPLILFWKVVTLKAPNNQQKYSVMVVIPSGSETIIFNFPPKRRPVTLVDVKVEMVDIIIDYAHAIFAGVELVM